MGLFCFVAWTKDESASARSGVHVHSIIRDNLLGYSGPFPENCYRWSRRAPRKLRNSLIVKLEHASLTEIYFQEPANLTRA
jgi:hypothetical protein